MNLILLRFLKNTFSENLDEFNTKWKFYLLLNPAKPHNKLFQQIPNSTSDVEKEW
ncbi:hypothetical protein CRC_02484 [Cylindrospermopsis raciborskii CS-505]|nr:hypothetical protein CRC_02484 [Cylindrospermopsis raciborskii CS-505]